jgi:hypothetical protein
VNKTLRALEAAARALPQGVVTGQVAPAAPPVVQPVAIRPEINPGAVTAALEMDGMV